MSNAIRTYRFQFPDRAAVFARVMTGCLNSATPGVLRSVATFGAHDVAISYEGGVDVVDALDGIAVSYEGRPVEATL